VPYLSALEVCSRQGAIQIHVYLTLPYLTVGKSTHAVDGDRSQGVLELSPPSNFKRSRQSKDRTKVEVLNLRIVIVLLHAMVCVDKLYQAVKSADISGKRSFSNSPKPSMKRH